MSVTSRSETDAAEADADSARQGARSRRQPGLNQPLRALIAVAELVLAGIALWLAFRWWPQGITEIDVPYGGKQIPQALYHGDVLVRAIGIGTLASLLLLDAMRQLMLALRTRPLRRAKRRERDAAKTPEDAAAA